MILFTTFLSVGCFSKEEASKQPPKEEGKPSNLQDANSTFLDARSIFPNEHFAIHPAVGLNTSQGFRLMESGLVLRNLSSLIQKKSPNISEENHHPKIGLKAYNTPPTMVCGVQVASRKENYQRSGQTLANAFQTPSEELAERAARATLELDVEMDRSFLYFSKYSTSSFHIQHQKISLPKKSCIQIQEKGYLESAKIGTADSWFAIFSHVQEIVYRCRDKQKKEIIETVELFEYGLSEEDFLNTISRSCQRRTLQNGNILILDITEF